MKSAMKFVKLITEVIMGTPIVYFLFHYFNISYDHKVYVMGIICAIGFSLKLLFGVIELVASVANDTGKGEQNGSDRSK